MLLNGKMFKVYFVSRMGKSMDLKLFKAGSAFIGEFCLMLIVSLGGEIRDLKAYMKAIFSALALIFYVILEPFEAFY